MRRLQDEGDVHGQREVPVKNLPIMGVEFQAAAGMRSKPPHYLVSVPRLQRPASAS